MISSSLIVALLVLAAVGSEAGGAVVLGAAVASAGAAVDAAELPVGAGADIAVGVVAEGEAAPLGWFAPQAAKSRVASRLQSASWCRGMSYSF